MTSKSEDIKDTVIEGIVKDLLSHLEVQGEVEVRQVDGQDEGQNEGERHFFITIKTEETGLLIGRHGETINSLQLILGVILYKKYGKWVRVILDVGNYRETREKNLREMVERIAAEVENTNEPVILPYLSPYERRLVHMMLSENPKITSESSGEGKDRRVTIKPR